MTIKLISNDQEFQKKLENLCEMNGICFKKSSFDYEKFEKKIFEENQIVIIDIDDNENQASILCQKCSKTNKHNFFVLVGTTSEEKLLEISFHSNAVFFEKKTNFGYISISKIKLFRNSLQQKTSNIIVQEIIQYKDIVIHKNTMTLTVNGKNINIRPKLLKFFETLLESSEKYIDYKDLFKKVWPENKGINNIQTIHTSVSSLRKILSKNESCVKIENKTNFGVRII